MNNDLVKAGQNILEPSQDQVPTCVSQGGLNLREMVFYESWARKWEELKGIWIDM